MAATAANKRIERHRVASGRDRAGRAEIEASSAAGLVAAAVGADRRVVGDVTRLVESADQIGDVEQRALDRDRVAGIGLEIAVAGIGGGKQRRRAAKVEDQIDGHGDAIALLTEGQGPAGARIGGRCCRTCASLARSNRTPTS